MDVRHEKDLFESFFKLTSFLFRPYLEHKYRPKKSETIVEKLWSVLIFLSTWLLIIFAYLVFLYFFIYSPEPGHSHLSDLWHKPPQDTAKAILDTIKVSIYFNITFLVVLYMAIINHAEKHFLSGKVLHLDLSGLIKTLKLAKYDDCSQINEQDANQIAIARKNVLAVVNNPAFEVLSIMTASGWEFFGEGPALPRTDKEPPKDVKPPKKHWWSSQKKKVQEIDNGYLLDLISKRYRQVRIILLDPESPTCNVRGNSYVDGNHKVHNFVLLPDPVWSDCPRQSGCIDRGCFVRLTDPITS